MAPPKALAPIKTGSSPKRPVRARGKARATNAIKCNILSLPLGLRGGCSVGQRIATNTVIMIANVRGMSRYLRTCLKVQSELSKGKRVRPLGSF